MYVFNFTILCMQKTSPANGTSAVDNTVAQHIHEHSRFTYTKDDKYWLFAAVAIGSIIGTFPFSILYTKFGARYVFFVAGLVSALATILIPTFADFGVRYFLAMRILQGLAYSADFAAIGVLCARWASLKQSAVFVSILTCFSPFSSVVANPISGAFCNSKWGWPAAYYFHGIIGIVLFILWVIFYTDQPATHKAVSTIELEKIHRNKTQAHINMDSFVPYWQILKNPVIWTVWLNAMADVVSGIFLLTYTPTMLYKALKYDVSATGWLGAIPAAAHIPFKICCGYFSDKIKSFPEHSKMIFFNSLALFVPGVLFIAVCFVPDSLPIIVVLLFSGIHAFLGANCGGFYKCAVLVSRQYSAFVVANIQFIKCLTLFIAPGLVSIFVPDETSKEQWQRIFMLLAAILILSNIVFFFFATAEPAEFTKITRETRRQKSAAKIAPAELASAEAGWQQVSKA
uniref:Major facilitator superfamily (MFS) profile domain-containing protein n=1 Tax=Panagrolaimus sp. JU765 TaxID=591449 RepID=A0AC34RG27_9BILA